MNLSNLINFCPPLKSSDLKSSGKHRFSGDFRENWSWLIYFNSFNVRSEFWRRSLNYHPLLAMRFPLPTVVVRLLCDAKNSDKNKATFPNLPCSYFMYSTFVAHFTKIDLPTTARAELFLTHYVDTYSEKFSGFYMAEKILLAPIFRSRFSISSSLFDGQLYIISLFLGWTMEHKCAAKEPVNRRR